MIAALLLAAATAAAPPRGLATAALAHPPASPRDLPSMSLPAPKRARKKVVLPASSHEKRARLLWTDSSARSVHAIAAGLSTADCGGGLRPGQFPALVLNADYTPLSYVPLSIWSWQDTMRAVFRDVVTVLASYDKVVSSPSVKMQLPSVIVLKQYVPHNSRSRSRPAFTRRNLYLRDGFRCRYCGQAQDKMCELTYDHVVPRSRQGATSWENVVTACKACNLRKGDRLLEHIPDMKLSRAPHQPTWHELQATARAFPPHHLHSDWIDYVL
ncbi:hypothetical protein AB1Y20_012479 [Prymnesium parvum]|uniref:HNH nuclease domain-containing protein n=1 Tax=Prymnesium parvum TaxID=97485 RepID=A0AB34II07_PRYPA